MATTQTGSQLRTPSYVALTGPPIEDVTMTESGRPLWQVQALPKIRAYYEEILNDFSVRDATRMLNYLLKMLESMQRLDQQWVGVADEDAASL